jgi:hypothetical protein
MENYSGLFWVNETDSFVLVIEYGVVILHKKISHYPLIFNGLGDVVWIHEEGASSIIFSLQKASDG